MPVFLHSTSLDRGSWYFPCHPNFLSAHNTNNFLATRRWPHLSSRGGNNFFGISCGFSLLPVQRQCSSRTSFPVVRPSRGGASDQFDACLVGYFGKAQPDNIQRLHVYFPPARVSSPSALDRRKLSMYSIRETRQDLVTPGQLGLPPILTDLGVEIANWEMLAGKEVKRAVKEGGALERGVRFSLTCRDVKRVSSTGSFLRR